MWFGTETSPITFRRRPVVADPTGGTKRGDRFEDLFTRQANVRNVTGRELVEAGVSVDSIDCIIRIRDGQLPRTLTSADRARLRNQDFEIITIGQPQRSGGYIEMTLRRQQGAT